MFGAFILSCGFSHFMEIVTSYTPLYRLSALVKLGTGLVSWATVACLVPVIPKALALRSPDELQREVDERKRVEAELRVAHAELEKRVQQLVATEEALRRSEAMFQGLFQFAPDAIVVTDSQGLIRLANLQTERLLGYRHDEIVGRRIEVLLSEACRDEHRQHEAQVTLPEAPGIRLAARELQACRKDGREVPVE